MTDFLYHGNTIYYSVYYIPFLVFSRKKETKKTRKSKKEKNAYLYTGRQEIISSLVRYVTAHDTHAIRKKGVPAKIISH